MRLVVAELIVLSPAKEGIALRNNSEHIRAMSARKKQQTKAGFQRSLNCFSASSNSHSAYLCESVVQIGLEVG